jgi:hypothetical protein
MPHTLHGRFVSRTLVAVAISSAVLAAGAGRAGADIPPAFRPMTLSPNSGVAGIQVVARGQLLPAVPLAGIWSEPVALYFGGQLVGTNGTDQMGRFSVRFRVPAQPIEHAHAVLVRAVGQTTGRSAIAAFYLT